MPFYCQVNNSEINILNFYHQIEQMNNKIKKHKKETVIYVYYVFSFSQINIWKIYLKHISNYV